MMDFKYTQWLLRCASCVGTERQQTQGDLEKVIMICSHLGQPPCVCVCVCVCVCCLGFVLFSGKSNLFLNKEPILNKVLCVYYLFFTFSESEFFVVVVVCFLGFFVCLFVCFCFLGPHFWHMEALRLGAQSEQRLPAYVTVIAIAYVHCRTFGRNNRNTIFKASISSTSTENQSWNYVIFPSSIF